jgi:hypothetical protein
VVERASLGCSVEFDNDDALGIGRPLQEFRARTTHDVADATNGTVHGLTTAASLCETAGLGVLCGLAVWKLLAVAVAGVLFLLLAGGSFEMLCQKVLKIEKADLPASQ